MELLCEIRVPIKLISCKDEIDMQALQKDIRAIFTLPQGGIIIEQNGEIEIGGEYGNQG